MSKLWLPLASIYGLMGVVFGAFGAHALHDRLTPELMAVWKTAVDYNFYHALALALVGVLLRQTLTDRRALNVAGACFALGVLLFSGSLYALVLSNVRMIGAVTPFGGLFFMIGWVVLAYAAIRTAK